MRTIYIMVEGPTEEEFVNNSIAPYLHGFGIFNAVPIPLETSPGFYGGDITFERYLKNAQNLLISDPNCIVTSLIDFYELRTDFPGYEIALTMQNRFNSVEYIEEQIYNTVGNERFVSYIQLHEFEGLLFSDIRGFQTYFPALVPHANFIINHYPNPEMINDSPNSSPSARLKELFHKISRRYKKTFHGPIIALENGMIPILTKCPRFNKWIETIIEKALDY